MKLGFKELGHTFLAALRAESGLFPATKRRDLC